jgi:hypothetical protein
MRGRTKAKKRHSAVISLGQLQHMHQTVHVACRQNNWGPGTEGDSLLAALDACLGNHPRVRRSTAERLVERYHALVGPHSRQDGP